MADRFLGLGIKYDQAASQAELTKLKEEIKASLQSFNLSVNLQGVVSEAQKVTNEMKSVLKDLAAYRRAQDQDLTREEVEMARVAAQEKKNVEKAAIREISDARKMSYRDASESVNQMIREMSAKEKAEIREVEEARKESYRRASIAVNGMLREVAATEKAQFAQASTTNKQMTSAGGFGWMTSGTSQASYAASQNELKAMKDYYQAAETAAATHSSLGKTIRELHANFLPLVAELYVAKQAWDMTAGAIMKYLADLETAQLGIAAGLMTGGQYIDQYTGKALKGDQAFRASQAQSKAIVNELRLANYESLATLDELVIAYQVTLPVALAKGFNPKMVKDFTLAMVQAAGAIGLPFNQMAEETRSLLTGTVNPRTSRIATVLGIRNEDINKYKGDVEGLFNFLMGKLQTYQIAGVEAQNSWKGLWSNTKDIALQAGGVALQPLFDTIKNELKKVQDQVLDIDKTTGKVKGLNPEFQESMKQASAYVEGMLRTLGSMAHEINSAVLPALDSVALALKLIPTSIEGMLAGAGAMGLVGKMLFGTEVGKIIFVFTLIEDVLQKINKLAGSNTHVSPFMGLGTNIDNLAALPGKLKDAIQGNRSWMTGQWNGPIPESLDNVLYGPKSGLEYKVNPPPDDNKKGKNLYGREAAADKAIRNAQLQALKSNLALQEHEIDRFHEYGLTTTIEYADAKREAVEKGLKDELNTENKMYPLILEDIRNKRDKALENDKEHTSTKAITESSEKELEAAKAQHIERMKVLENNAAKQYIDIQYKQYQDLLSIQMEVDKHAGAMGGISAQGTLDVVQAQVERQKTLNDYLFEAKKINAVKWYSTQDALDTKEAEGQQEKIRADLANYKTTNESKWVNAQGNSEKLAEIYREQAEKEADAKRQIDKLDSDLQTKMLARELQRLDSVQYAYGQGGYEGAVKKSLELVSREYVDVGKNIQDATKSITSAMENSFLSFFDHTSANFLKFGTLATDILNEIYKATLKALIIQPLMGAITGGISGLVTGSSSGITGDVMAFAPRASGGPTDPGGTYIVGENGPERLYMGSNRGYVAPGTGSGNIAISVVVNNQGSPVNVTRQEVSQVNPDEYVVNLWLSGYAKNVGGIRDAFGG